MLSGRASMDRHGICHGIQNSLIWSIAALRHASLTTHDDFPAEIELEALYPASLVNDSSLGSLVK